MSTEEWADGEKYTCGCALLPYKSCPLHGGEPVVKYADWMMRAARYIIDAGVRITSVYDTKAQLQLASIIAAHAEPLVALLRESKRTHDRGYNEESCDYPPCPKSRDEENSGPGELEDTCTCSADAWNAKVEAVLAGSGPSGQKP